MLEKVEPLYSTGGFLSNYSKSSAQQIIYIDSTISNTKNGIAVRDMILLLNNKLPAR